MNAQSLNALVSNMLIAKGITSVSRRTLSVATKSKLKDVSETLSFEIPNDVQTANLQGLNLPCKASLASSEDGRKVRASMELSVDGSRIFLAHDLDSRILAADNIESIESEIFK